MCLAHPIFIGKYKDSHREVKGFTMENLSESEKSSTWHSSRRLTCQGLKPSDYFLYKQEKDYFDFDMRELFVLGLRSIYSLCHDPAQRERILTLARTIKTENLDKEKDRPEYTFFQKVMEL